jgi:3-deoxy-D-manno-octulosonate 8-phosphate phosphatase (KDO 8-P phosphatase)
MGFTMDEIIAKAQQIKCLISDVDGVLTSGLLYLDDHGVETKAFHVHDGMGLKLLMCAGIEVAIITTSLNPVIKRRMDQLGIKHYFQGQIDKRDAYTTLKERLGLQDHQFAYVGDDLPDLGVMNQVGLPVAVSNALGPVINGAYWVTKKSGGLGAVRELCDLILLSQGKTELALANYLSS